MRPLLLLLFLLSACAQPEPPKTVYRLDVVDMELARAYVWVTRAMTRCPNARTEFILISDTALVLQSYYTLRGYDYGSNPLRGLTQLLYESVTAYNEPMDRDTCLITAEKIRSSILSLAGQRSD